MMKEKDNAKFLDFILQVQAISKIGLKFSTDQFALENYQKLQELSTDCLQDFTDTELSRINFFERDIYPTPSVSVRGYIINERDELLLVQEKNSNTWSVPGGWCDIGDSPSQAVISEVLQEAGLNVTVERVLGILMRNMYQGNRCSTTEYAISFHCVVQSGQFIENHETIASSYFPINALPELSTKTLHEEIFKNYNVLVNKLPSAFD